MVGINHWHYSVLVRTKSCPGITIYPKHESKRKIVASDKMLQKNATPAFSVGNDSQTLVPHVFSATAAASPTECMKWNEKQQTLEEHWSIRLQQTGPFEQQLSMLVCHWFTGFCARAHTHTQRLTGKVKTFGGVLELEKMKKACLFFQSPSCTAFH